jgi:hypothetical protein
VVLFSLVITGCDPRSPVKEPSVALEVGGETEKPYAGYALGFFYGEEDADYEALLWEAARQGATAINLVVMRTQEDILASRIRPSAAHTPKDSVIRRTVGYARQLGMKVALMPIIHLENRGPGRWRGVLEPEDEEGWWASYEEFVFHYAKIAGEEGVDWFFVGSELGSLEADVVRWANIIEEVRELGDFSVTYSANWDRFEKTPFWNRLDAIGISLYEPVLEDAVDAQKAEIATFRAHVESFASRHDSPIIVSEFGFPSRPSAQSQPWNASGEATADLATQETLTERTLDVWCGVETLESVFIWNLHGIGGGLDSNFDIRRKPVAGALTQWRHCRREAE